MYALVIGANGETVHDIKAAQRQGMKVLAFDGNQNAEGLRYANESFVVDIRNPENIYAVIDAKGIHPEEMVVVPVPIGRYLTSAGSVNDHYQLVGTGRKTADICTDKWLFHQTLHREGLRNIDCRILERGSVREWYQSFPVIVKPRFGSGSRKVCKISDAAGWKGFSDEMPFDEDFMIEDAVDGTEYGIDGMVFHGTFHLVLVRKKIMTPPPYRQCVGYLSVNRKKENGCLLTKIEQFMRKLVKTIELENGILHADLIDDGKNLFVIEMSARPSGHWLHDVFTPLVTGVDMVSQFLKFASTGESHVVAANAEQVFMIRYFDMETDVVRIPDREEMLKKYPLVEYECSLKIGHMDPVRDDALMGRGFFIVKGDDEKAVCEVAAQVRKEFV